MKRVLIFTNGTPPLDSRMPASGDGLRAWQLYQGLRSHGFEVDMSLYKGVSNKFEKFISNEMKNISFQATPKSQENIIDLIQPDVILAIHWPTIFFKESDIPVVLDFHGPHLLERSFQKHRTLSKNLDDKLSILQKADFFTCAGDYQKYYFVAMLLQAGIVDVIDKKLINSIPISLDPVLPLIDYNKKAKDPIRFVFSGMFLPWQDPFSSFKATSEILNKYDSGVLEIFGGRHPVYPMDSRLFDEFIEESKYNHHIEFRGLIPRSKLIEEYKQAHVALDLMNWNLERELAFTTRTVEYLWSGLPVIYNNYSELSQYIERYKAGWCLDPERPEEIRETVAQILGDRDLLLEYSTNAQKLVKEKFTWDKTIVPIANFCKNPKKRSRSFDVPPKFNQGLKCGSLIERTLQCYNDNGMTYTLMKMAQQLRYVKR